MKVIDFQDASCRHCYKCVRYCAVKAISVKNEQAHIMEDHCIHCGRCLEVCPQNAKTFASDMERVKGYLHQGMKVVISIAPSYLGVLKYKKPGQIVAAIEQLGFAEVRETAEGAALVTAEYVRLLEEGTMPNIITTCCPAVNDLIEKYYPEVIPLMAPVVSPMVAHGRYIKKLYGEDVKVVFLGPCIAKKQEAVGDRRVQGAVDAILTFEDLGAWFTEAGIDVYDCPEKPMGNPNPNVNRLYPISGGVIQSVVKTEGVDTYHKVYVDGLEACMEMLESVRDGEVEHCFIEANVCVGGCVKGPASGQWDKSFVRAKVDVEKEVEHKPADLAKESLEVPMEKVFEDAHMIEREPSEGEIREILKQTSKYSSTDELNCGACGYSTCRAKAIAVYQNKAEVDMCLPFALMQAESMSNVVMDATPNMIFVVDQELRIRECNVKAQKFLGVGREEALERYIFEFMDPSDIERVIKSREAIMHRKVYLEKENIFIEESIVYVDEINSVLIIFEDITKQEEAKKKHYNLKVETVDMAQAVIDKQMMVAQEIAGLLGETTAETKVTLSRLRDSILDEEEG